MTKPNRRNDVRVALLANLTAAHSMLKDAHERKISPNKTMGSDKMFIEMLTSMEETMDRARNEIWPKADSKVVLPLSSKPLDRPATIDYLMTHTDDEEVKRIMKVFTTRDLTPEDWKVIFECRDRLWESDNAKPEDEVSDPQK